MFYKNKKILESIAPFIDEGVILLYPNYSIEILTKKACSFLKISNKTKKLHLYQLPENAISKKLELMIDKNIKEDSIDSDNETLIITIIEVGTSDLKVIVIKDDSNHERMLNMGKEFVGNASHELRTPITIIKGFTEMLIEGEGIDEKMQREILKKIQSSCERMEHLVKHLLRLTDLENCEIEAKAAVDVQRLIEDVSYQVISIYPDFRIEHLRKDEEALAWIDSDLIELVLTNLFKNSVKYCREEKVIIVKVDTSFDQIYIKITDSGKGIPTKDLEKVFERFYTVDKAHCRKLGGAGLGLSIVKLIVEKHGGKIYATSEPGLSTTMHLYLPKAPSPLPVALK
jgi:two-component system phosphate regulon sensor histidine kinase PhoR